MFESALAAVPLVGIIRLDEPGAADAAADALYEGGLTVVEIAMTTPDALAAVTAVRARRASGTVVGAGSVRTAEHVAAALAAGAEFLVTPTFNPDVITAAGETPVLCGAFTPTEMDAAVRAGARYVKLFPASQATPAYLREVLAPMPELRIVPTGGVTLENLPAWFDAGASAVAVGGALVPRGPVVANDISRRAEAFAKAATGS